MLKHPFGFLVWQVFDSTGARHRQLVKSGNDDMRQDAVMQQFFTLVNSLLAACPATRTRRLRIATYKVSSYFTYACAFM